MMKDSRSFIDNSAETVADRVKIYRTNLVDYKIFLKKSSWRQSYISNGLILKIDRRNVFWRFAWETKFFFVRVSRLNYWK